MIGKYLDETLRKFEISGKAIADASGFTQAFISAMRNGKSNPSADGLLTLLDGLEKINPESRWFFCELLSGRHGRPMQVKVFDAFDGDVAGLTRFEMGRVLMEIGRKLRSEASTKKETTSESNQKETAAA